MKKILPIALIFWACTKNNTPTPINPPLDCLESWQTNRLHGGNKLTASQVPFLVALQMKFVDAQNKPYYTSCTGSIVSNTWILTAAHCLSAKTVDQKLDALAFAFVSPEYANLKLYNISQAGVYIHPKYTQTGTSISRDYDYALINVSQSFAFGDKVAPVLVRYNDGIPHIYGKTPFTLFTLGWTQLLPEFGTAELLLQAYQAIQPSPDVNDFLRSRIKPQTLLGVEITNTKLLAEERIALDRFSAVVELTLKNKGTLPGDSGSPLLLLHLGGHYLIGVTSTGSPSYIVQNFLFWAAYARLERESNWFFSTTGLKEAKIQGSEIVQSGASYQLDIAQTALEYYQKVETYLLTGDCRWITLPNSQKGKQITTTINQNILRDLPKQTNVRIVFKFYYGGSYHNVVSKMVQVP